MAPSDVEFMSFWLGRSVRQVNAHVNGGTGQSLSMLPMPNGSHVQRKTPQSSVMMKTVPGRPTRPPETVSMGHFFQDPLFERFAVRALSHALYGGADFGECFVTAAQITPADPDSWYRAWTATADRVFHIAESCAAAGRSVSAREAYLRASNYYRTAWLPLFGAPVDDRLVAAFDREAEAFARAAAGMSPAVEAVEIPYEGTSLPGYFHRADDSGQPRPTVIATNGYDATVHEAHFAHAVAAVRRGYHCLTFDGPGQGRPLIHQGLVFRPDWENVVRPVVDYALSRPEVDP